MVVLNFGVSLIIHFCLQVYEIPTVPPLSKTAQLPNTFITVYL